MLEIENLKHWKFKKQFGNLKNFGITDIQKFSTIKKLVIVGIENLNI